MWTLEAMRRPPPASYAAISKANGAFYWDAELTRRRLIEAVLASSVQTSQDTVVTLKVCPRTAVSELGERLWEDYQNFARRHLSEYEIVYRC
jgi:hypothetical protein